MINLTEQKNNRIKISIIAISVLLLIVSFTQTAFYVGIERNDAIDASMAFFFGWMVLISSGISWLANFFLISSWILLFSKPKYSQYCSFLAILFALSFLLFDGAIVSSSGSPRTITAYGIGYWLWLTSCVSQAIAVTAFNYKKN